MRLTQHKHNFVMLLEGLRNVIEALEPVDDTYISLHALCSEELMEMQWLRIKRRDFNFYNDGSLRIGMGKLCFEKNPSKSLSQTMFYTEHPTHFPNPF